MSTTPIIVNTDVPSGSNLSRRPTRAEVKTAICAEAQAAGIPCSGRLATDLLKMLDVAVSHARRHQYMEYYLTDEDLARCHAVMDVVMPDVLDLTKIPVPAADSAQDLINRLYVRDREFAIAHTQDQRYSNRTMCAVAVVVGKI